jgi:glutathione S-transferase
VTYTLYYAPGTASLCLHWLLIELDVPFEAVAVDFAAGDQRTAEFLRLNPAGRVPTLVVDGAGYGESAALLMWLAERHAAFAPAPGTAERGRWLETMAWLSSTVGSAMRDWFYADKDGPPEGAAAVRDLARSRIEAAWARLDDQLADRRPYVLGEAVSTADLLATMYMRWSRNMTQPATSWPLLTPYVTQMRARPAFAEVCRREGLTEWLNAAQ